MVHSWQRDFITWVGFSCPSNAWLGIRRTNKRSLLSRDYIHQSVTPNCHNQNQYERQTYIYTYTDCSSLVNLSSCANLSMSLLRFCRISSLGAASYLVCTSASCASIFATIACLLSTSFSSEDTWNSNLYTCRQVKARDCYIHENH